MHMGAGLAMTRDERGSDARRRLHRAGLYLGLVGETRLDDGLTYRQRLRTNWQRQWRSNCAFSLWFLVVISVSDLVRWYVTALVAVGLGAGFSVLAAVWQTRRDRRREPANAPLSSPDGPASDR
jgi:hypothetical protein